MLANRLEAREFIQQIATKSLEIASADISTTTEYSEVDRQKYKEAAKTISHEVVGTMLNPSFDSFPVDVKLHLMHFFVLKGMKEAVIGHSSSIAPLIQKLAALLRESDDRHVR